MLSPTVQEDSGQRVDHPQPVERKILIARVEGDRYQMFRSLTARSEMTPDLRLAVRQWAGARTLDAESQRCKQGSVHPH
jgi:hypothetical protein